MKETEKNRLRLEYVCIYKRTFSNVLTIEEFNSSILLNLKRDNIKVTPYSILNQARAWEREQEKAAR